MLQKNVRASPESCNGETSNPLYETRLHDLTLGDVIDFESRHVLMDMNQAQIRQIADWLEQQ